MDLALDRIHEHLRHIDVEGWESAVGSALLDVVRLEIVRPVVRRSGLRGPAADQAEASAWAAAWDALRRPSARAADNPVGMAWVAARRAVAREQFAGDRAWPTQSGAPGSGASAAEPSGEQNVPAGMRLVLIPDPATLFCDEIEPPVVERATLGPAVDAIVEVGVHAGWARDVLEDVICHMADLAAPTPECGSIPWRRVSVRLGLPQWRVRRLAHLIVGPPGNPARGLLALVTVHGAGVLDEPAIRRAVRSTVHRSVPAPEVLLEGWGSSRGSRRGGSDDSNEPGGAVAGAVPQCA